MEKISKLVRHAVHRWAEKRLVEKAREEVSGMSDEKERTCEESDETLSVDCPEAKEERNCVDMMDTDEKHSGDLGSETELSVNSGLECGKVVMTDEAGCIGASDEQRKPLCLLRRDGTVSSYVSDG